MLLAVCFCDIPASAVSPCCNVWPVRSDWCAHCKCGPSSRPFCFVDEPFANCVPAVVQRVDAVCGGCVLCVDGWTGGRVGCVAAVVTVLCCAALLPSSRLSRQ